MYREGEPEPQYLHSALSVLGTTRDDFFPPAVQEAYRQLGPPADIDWTGSPIWKTAYVAALRAMATARRQARTSGKVISPQDFNDTWGEINICGRPDGQPKVTHVGDVALRKMTAPFQDALRRALRRVQFANNALMARPEDLPSASWSQEQGERAGLQSYVADSLQWFSVSPPRMSELTKFKRPPQFPDALLVVLPTGSGKTKVAGDWLASQGVGRAKGSPKVLWVTDQQKLVDDCLNPNKTLRRCLPPRAKVTSVWEGHKTEEDASGQVVVITKASLEAEMESGLIRPDEYDIVVFDEADIMLSELKQSLIRRFDACKKLFLTATPSRNIRKDLQRMMHHVRPLTLLEAAERGVIAPVRILTYVARDQAHAEELAASIGLHLFIKQGKKGVAYCQPGGQNAQAERIVKLIGFNAKDALGGIYRASQVYAEMVGSARRDSAKVINHFETKVKAGLLGTCSMLERGWDPNRLDGCILVGPQGDYVGMTQEIGRSFRLEPDNPDKIALIVQIKYPSRTGQNDYTAEMAFGLETVASGAIIGPSEDGSRGPRRDPEFEKMLADLPDELKVTLQPLGRPLSQVLIAPDDPRYKQYVRPEGYDTAISELLARFPGVPKEWFYYQFHKFSYKVESITTSDGQTVSIVIKIDGKDKDKATGEAMTGIPFATIRNLSPEAGQSAERFYDTAVINAFLATVDVPKVAQTGSLSVGALAKQLKVPPTLVGVAARELGMQKQDNELTAERGGSKAGWRLNLEEQRRIIAWVEAIEVADDTKVWYTELTKKYGRFVSTYFTAKRIKPETLRHPLDGDLNGIGPYVDVDDAAAMEAEYRRIRTLMRTHRSVGDIARRVGVSKETVVRLLTPDEEAMYNDPATRFSPIGGTKKPSRHLPGDVADAIEARLLNQLLELHEVSRSGIAQWLGISETRVAQLANEYKLDPKRIGPRGSQAAIYHIAALGPIRDFYSDELRTKTRPSNVEKRRLAAIREKLAAIHFEQLPRFGEELTPEQGHYALSVQRDILNIPENLLNGFPFVPEEHVVDAVPGRLESEASPTGSVQESVAAVALETSVSPPDIPDTPARVDYQTAIQRLSVEKHALVLLMREAKIAEDQLTRDEGGEIIDFSAEAFTAMDGYRVGPPVNGWIRLASIARAGAATPEIAFEKLLEIEGGLMRLFGQQEWQLGRSGVLVEIYVHPTVGTRAQRELKVMSAERSRNPKRSGASF